MHTSGCFSVMQRTQLGVEVSETLVRREADLIGGRLLKAELSAQNMQIQTHVLEDQEIPTAQRSEEYQWIPGSPFATQTWYWDQASSR